MLTGTIISCVMSRSWCVIKYKYFNYLDIDECTDDEQNDCDPNAMCSNTVGSYICRCLRGYEGDGKDCIGKYISFYVFYMQLAT